MKLAWWIFGLLLVIGGIDDIATINRLKKQAEEAYQSGDYAQAVQYYQTLVDSLQVDDEKVRLNLAHAQLQVGDTATAQRQYGQLMNAGDASIKSVAYQQLGNITTQQQQYQDALAMYKESLKANPANEDSRYNYELVKKLQQEQEQQQQSQSDNNQEQSEEQKDQQNQDQQNQEQSEQQQDQQGESTDESNSEEQQNESEQQQGEQEPTDAEEQNTEQGEQQNEGEKSEEEMESSPLSERLQEMNISEEKARMILEAMRNNEMQYIQQNRRKATKPRDRTKPDW